MKKYIVLALFFLAAWSHAQTVKEKPRQNAEEKTAFNLNLYVENDTQRLGGPGSDSSYTNGIKISYLYAVNKEPKWVSLVPWIRKKYEDHTFNFGMGLGHQIFTPENLSRGDAILRDRPYAGWFYLSPTLSIISEHFVDTMELDIGIIGPYAFGKEVQREFHRLIEVPLPQGWDHQLGTEMGLQVALDRKYKFLKTDFYDLIPYLGVGVGNVYDGISAGSLLRLGYNIPSDFGPSRPSSSDGDAAVRVQPPEEGGKKHWRFYGFAGLKGSAIARNIFLDGNTLQDSLRVTRIPLVYEHELGLYLQYKMFAITWRQIGRSAEFYENPRSHNFGSLALTFGKRF